MGVMNPVKGRQLTRAGCTMSAFKLFGHAVKICLRSTLHRTV